MVPYFFDFIKNLAWNYYSVKILFKNVLCESYNSALLMHCLYKRVLRAPNGVADWLSMENNNFKPEKKTFPSNCFFKHIGVKKYVIFVWVGHTVVIMLLLCTLFTLKIISI